MGYQAWTLAQRIQAREHPDFITATRNAFLMIGKPWVIENVPGAPLRHPTQLCGCMFSGLNVYRPRLFETSWPVVQPDHREHREPVTKMGRPPRAGERMHVVGNFSGVAEARAAMGINWMSRDELRESIPPAYTEFLGGQLLAVLEVAA